MNQVLILTLEFGAIALAFFIVWYLSRKKKDMSIEEIDRTFAKGAIN